MKRYVAGDGDYADDLELRRCKREQDRGGVIAAGVGVNNDFPRFELAGRVFDLSH
jgi:hypothetical protein